MQHSVQHKNKLGEKERERASVRNSIHCAWLVGSMAASYLRENMWISFGIPGEPAQMKFEMASGCEWEWVATCCNTHTHKNPPQNIHIKWVETRADVTSVTGAVVFGGEKLLQTKTWSLPREMLRTFTNDESGDLEILRENAETNTIMNWDEPQTITILRSSRSEGAPHPPCAPPSICHVIGRVWMDPLCMNVWTQCRGARFISSQRDAPTGRRPPPPPILRWAGPGVRLNVSRVRENGRMSCVCLAACVTGECAVLGEKRMRSWGGQNKKDTNRHLKIEKRNNTLSKGCREEILPLEGGWSSNLRKDELWIY